VHSLTVCDSIKDLIMVDLRNSISTYVETSTPE
jgi:hypothetical protein